MDIIAMLQDGTGALAWLTALLLALGGTAVVVAAWTQMRRGVPAVTVLKAIVGIKPARPARTEPAQPAGRPADAAAPRSGEPVNQALRAYRAESDLNPDTAPARTPAVEHPQPEPEAALLTERQLTVYLNRLRRAADTLEEVARGEAGHGAVAEERALSAIR